MRPMDPMEAGHLLHDQILDNCISSLNTADVYTLSDQYGRVSTYTIEKGNKPNLKIKIVRNKTDGGLSVLVNNVELPIDDIDVNVLPGGKINMNISLTIEKGVNGYIDFDTEDRPSGVKKKNSVKLNEVSRRLDV
jgi:hypothetical protein